MVRSSFEITLARVALVAVTAYFTVGLIVPVLSIGFQFDSTAQFVEALFSKSTLSALRISLIQSALSTLGSLLLGTLITSILYRFKIRSALVEWMLSIPYTVPTIVASFTWILILSKTGPLGFLNINYSLTAVIVAHIFLNAPFVGLSLHQAMIATPRDEIDSARSLCTSPVSLVLQYWRPRLQSALVHVSSQVFSICATSFILVMVLGGGPPIETLETGIFSRIRFGNPDWSGAAALALWQLILCSLPALLILRKTRLHRLETIRSQSMISRSKLISSSVLISPLLFIYFIPYLSSPFFQSGILGTDFLRSYLFAITDSLALTLISCGLACLQSLLIYAISLRYLRAHNLLLLLAQIPAGVSTLILCLGVWFSFGSWIDPFEGRVVIIAFIQSVLMMPFMIRGLSSSVQGAKLQALEEARSLGASFLQTLWLIVWPQFRRCILLVMTVSAGISFSEIAAVSFFSSESFTPLPLLMSRYMGQYRFAEAELISLTLLVVAIALTSVQFMIGRKYESSR